MAGRSSKKHQVAVTKWQHSHQMDQYFSAVNPHDIVLFEQASSCADCLQRSWHSAYV
jgi:hypothetical protein